MKATTKILIIRLGLIILIAGAIYQWGYPFYRQYLTEKDKTPDIKTVAVKEGPFKVSFHQNGALEAKISVPVISSIQGKIIKLVTDGSNVKTGDLISQLDTENIEKAIRDAKLQNENYNSEIQRYRNQLAIYKETNKSLITQAQMQLDYDTSELERVKQKRDKKQSLADDKIVARDDVEKIDSEVRAKELIVILGKNNLELRRKEAETNEKQIMSYLETIEAISILVKSELERVEMMLEKATITAPAAGMVILAQIRDPSGSGLRAIREGDDVNPQNSICEIPNLSTMRIKAQVNESLSSRVIPGMEVIIKFEAVEKRIFHGTVTGIANLATTEDPRTGMTNASGTKTIAVMIDVTDKDTRVLKPGMTADVEFLEKSINKALYIPKSAIIEKNGKTTVYKKIDDLFINIPVATGSINDTSVCITKGLKKGDTIALRDPNLEQAADISDKDSTGNKPKLK